MSASFRSNIRPGKKRQTLRGTLLVGVLLGCGMQASRAWDYEGHRVVNQLALASLPRDFPAFVQEPEARERIAFLSGEPDRWRNTPDLPLRHANGPDHFLDLDELPLYGLAPAALSPYRHDFTVQLAEGRAAHPANFPPIDPATDADHTKALIGFLPWTIAEYHARVKSAFSYLRELEQGGTGDEIANARENVIYLMGVLGHFVGDAGQPLHATRHHNGWVGDNPDGFTTNRSFHAWIDGGYLQKFGLDTGKLRPAIRPARLLEMDGTAVSPTNVFPALLAFLSRQSEKVRPLYQLEKDGKLSAQAEISTEAHRFLTTQIVTAAQMLGDMWYTAWRTAPPDTYLRSALARRKLPDEKNSKPASNP